MFGPIARLQSGPTTAAAIMALGLAAICSGLAVDARNGRAALEVQVSALQQQLRDVRLAASSDTSCPDNSSSETQPPTPIPGRLADLAPSEAVPELLLRAPQGLDACARMEAADAAVVSTLGK